MADPTEDPTRVRTRYSPVATPQKERRACDECGKPASVELRINPGEVLVDGKYMGSIAYLCAYHGEIDGKQPSHCSKVFFLWP